MRMNVNVIYLCLSLMLLTAIHSHAANYPKPHLPRKKSLYVHHKDEPTNIKQEKSYELLMEAVRLSRKYPDWVRAEIEKPNGYFSDIANGGYLVYTTPNGYLHHPKFPKGKAIRVADITTSHDPGSGARYDRIVRELDKGKKATLELGVHYNPQTGRPGYIHTTVYKLPDGVTIGSSYYTNKIPQGKYGDATCVMQLLEMGQAY